MVETVVDAEAPDPPECSTSRAFAQFAARDATTIGEATVVFCAAFWRCRCGDGLTAIVLCTYIRRRNRATTSDMLLLRSKACLDLIKEEL
jgi:hypothetical protein